MSSDQSQRDTSNGREDQGDHQVRDIHALTPPSSGNRVRQRESWDTSSEGASSENFTTMSREFNALVLAGSVIGGNGANENDGGITVNNLARIGEEEQLPEETNPLAIVPDNNPRPDPVPSPRRATAGGGGSSTSLITEEVTMQRVRREETESKISAWQTAKIAKINNRLKREDAIINGWEGEQVQKATSWMKKVEDAVQML
ncbi:PREDICTED: uncharacterized protein LOC104597404 isoform X2 [Nelumbo nucifera]|uniref:Uncharacterized protein LOC104597404 isoform X2 n=2 Tax=Nelumbo nucifera TaxID=4432 RepID=A0A1U7ZY14_NELNU|nr:PREDICTED: uncharacterized protein LOC104597404 isoform X2 [Nelumbo nucifera]DAD42373.1 TPA_asm: hypothetical protein HUJ06_000603 [Nelumbo nucifera]